MDTYGGDIEHGMVEGVKSSVQNIFTLDFLGMSGSSTCAMVDATPVTKVVIRGAFVATVLSAFALLYLISRLCKSNIGCCKQMPNFGRWQDFGRRVLASLFEVFLLSYAIITKLIISMLNCKLIGDNLVLYLQGDIQCYKSWQFALAAAAATWVAPFWLYISLLPIIIKGKQIQTKGLFFGCIFPIPFILYHLVIKWIANKKFKNQIKTIGCNRKSSGDCLRQDSCRSAIPDWNR